MMAFYTRRIVANIKHLLSSWCCVCASVFSRRHRAMCVCIDFRFVLVLMCVFFLVSMCFSSTPFRYSLTDLSFDCAQCKEVQNVYMINGTWTSVNYTLHFGYIYIHNIQRTICSSHRFDHHSSLAKVPLTVNFFLFPFTTNRNRWMYYVENAKHKTDRPLYLVKLCVVCTVCQFDSVFLLLLWLQRWNSWLLTIWIKSKREKSLLKSIWPTFYSFFFCFFPIIFKLMVHSTLIVDFEYALSLSIYVCVCCPPE